MLATEALSESPREFYSLLSFYCLERKSAKLVSKQFIYCLCLLWPNWLSEWAWLGFVEKRRVLSDKAAGALGNSLTARAGIGLEKFQTIFMLLGANLFCGINLGRCLLLLPLEQLPEVID